MCAGPPRPSFGPVCLFDIIYLPVWVSVYRLLFVGANSFLCDLFILVFGEANIVFGFFSCLTPPQLILRSTLQTAQATNVTHQSVQNTHRGIGLGFCSCVLVSSECILCIRRGICLLCMRIISKKKVFCSCSKSVHWLNCSMLHKAAGIDRNGSTSSLLRCINLKSHSEQLKQRKCLVKIILAACFVRLRVLLRVWAQGSLVCLFESVWVFRDF